ncbi:metallophosphoesterase family protein [Thermus thermamylovorans]|uniref:Nuclease SbcCD subunit D n=1 Tax=Thermus thermamylovorans TaxID=2509362 RepID=A0A4Q9B795_9DEIN|nr:exonuclease SbcCD subunit D [Thermus thermamylovorans]TBH21672.1 exonuclease SbcCD subunit D [Thermus thermamylovorans]
MRLLHTADWHLGKVLKGVDRTPEVGEALKALLEIAREGRVDLVVVAGDLFDRPQVSAEAEAYAVEFFLRLRELGIPALVIAGNHDPKERLEALAPLFALAGAEVRGRPLLKEEGGVVAVKGGLRAALLPFVSERVLVKKVFQGEEDRHRAYAEAMRRILANLQSPLMLGHFALEGARPGGGEFVFHLAGSYAVPPSALPLSARYLALGHLHRQQQASEAPLAWYPGSLVQLDFGEGEEAERGALLVELPPSGPPRVHPIRERWGKPLKTFRLRPEELDGRLPEMERFPGHLRLVVEGRLSPAVKERLFQALPRLLAVETGGALAEEGGGALPEGLGFVEAYGRYLEERGRREEALLERFAQLLKEVELAALAPGA